MIAYYTVRRKRNDQDVRRARRGLWWPEILFRIMYHCSGIKLEVCCGSVLWQCAVIEERTASGEYEVNDVLNRWEG